MEYPYHLGRLTKLFSQLRTSKLRRFELISPRFAQFFFAGRCAPRTARCARGMSIFSKYSTDIVNLPNSAAWRVFCTQARHVRERCASGRVEWRWRRARERDETRLSEKDAPGGELCSLVCLCVRRRAFLREVPLVSSGRAPTAEMPENTDAAEAWEALLDFVEGLADAGDA